MAAVLFLHTKVVRDGDTKICLSINISCFEQIQLISVDFERHAIGGYGAFAGINDAV